jgi:hypothetical protein
MVLRHQQVNRHIHTLKFTAGSALNCGKPMLPFAALVSGAAWAAAAAALPPLPTSTSTFSSTSASASSPLFFVADVVAKDPVTVTLQTSPQYIAPGPTSASWGSFNDTIDSTGWAVLDVHTSPTFDDEVQAYAAGYAEGFLTQQVGSQAAAAVLRRVFGGKRFSSAGESTAKQCQPSLVGCVPPSLVAPAPTHVRTSAAQCRVSCQRLLRGGVRGDSTGHLFGGPFGVDRLTSAYALTPRSPSYHPPPTHHRPPPPPPQQQLPLRVSWPPFFEAARPPAAFTLPRALQVAGTRQNAYWHHVGLLMIQQRAMHDGCVGGMGAWVDGNWGSTAIGDASGCDGCTVVWSGEVSRAAAHV